MCLRHQALEGLYLASRAKANNAPIVGVLQLSSAFPSPLASTMIRRNPTLIPMTDSDVQDIRDMVLAEKAEENKQQMMLNTMAKLIQTPGISREDRELQDVMKNTAEKEQEELRNKMFNPKGGEYPRFES